MQTSLLTRGRRHGTGHIAGVAQSARAWAQHTIGAHRRRAKLSPLRGVHRRQHLHNSCCAQNGDYPTSLTWHRVCFTASAHGGVGSGYMFIYDASFSACAEPPTDTATELQNSTYHAHLRYARQDAQHIGRNVFNGSPTTVHLLPAYAYDGLDG